jgi:hypothetical protein
VIKLVQSGDRWLFRCPGCHCAHGVDSRWTVTGGEEKPTIRASVLVHATEHVHDGKLYSHPRCHSFVTDGRIEFLTDSTHALAGQTVDLPSWEEGTPE